MAGDGVIKQDEMMPVGGKKIGADPNGENENSQQNIEDWLRGPASQNGERDPKNCCHGDNKANGDGYRNNRLNRQEHNKNAERQNVGDGRVSEIQRVRRDMASGLIQKRELFAVVEVRASEACSRNL